MVNATLNHRAPRAARGYSLIELMVAIVVSMILLAGVIELFIGNKQAYRLQEGFSRLNENSRYATMVLNRSLRMGDHWGGVGPDVVEVDGGVAINGDCAEIPAESSVGFEALEGDANSPAPGCVADADYVPDSDILVVRYANPQVAPLEDADLDADSIYVRSNIGVAGAIARGEDVDDLGINVYDAGVDPADQNYRKFVNYPFQMYVYFLRPCSVPGGNGVCDANDDGGNPVPTLARLALDNSATPPALVQQDVVEGVEQMQAEFGVDDDADGAPDQYFDPDEVDANDWSKVVAVRLSLIIRNPEIDVTQDDTGSEYDMAGGYTYTVAADDGVYKRKLLTTIIQVRNQNRE